MRIVLDHLFKLDWLRTNDQNYGLPNISDNNILICSNQPEKYMFHQKIIYHCK